MIFNFIIIIIAYFWCNSENNCEEKHILWWSGNEKSYETTVIRLDERWVLV